VSARADRADGAEGGDAGTGALAVPGRRRHTLAAPRLDASERFMLALVLCVSVAILALPAIVLWLSFREAPPTEPVSAYSFLHYAEAFGDPSLVRAMANTLVFTLVSLVVALFFGVPAAWLVTRTDLPAKLLVDTLMTIGLLMPGFAGAMGWLFLLHPRIGVVNQLLSNLFGLHDAPLNIASPAGMGWVMGLGLGPLAYVMTASVLRSIDPVLEEAALVSGAPLRSTIGKITLPLAWPGILAAGIYIFTIGFAAFDVPAIIGWANKTFTFSTYMLLQLGLVEGSPHYGAVAALSTVVMALAALLIWWYSRLQRQAYRYQVVTGKGYRPRIVALGRHVWTAWGFLGIYFVLDKLLPLLVIVWAALLPYFRYPSAAAFKTLSLSQFRKIDWGLTFEAVRHSAALMILTPAVTLVIAVAFSWVVLRSKLPGRSGFDFVAFLPHAVPNIVFGFAALLFTLFVIRNVIPVYGTIWILLFVFVIARLSYATRMTNATLIQIHKDLEEAAMMSGASTAATLRRVILPLLAPTLGYAWLWIALLVYRELTLAVLLTTRDNLTLPVLVWNMWAGGGLGPAAALTLVLMAFMIPLVALYWWAMRRRGPLHAA
jgi:iron(III) transport system permease protein